MSLNKVSNQDIDELEVDYDLLDIQIIKNIEMLIIIIKINNENLNKGWKDLNSLLSEYAEEFIDTIFQRWNIYILYVVIDGISKELNYRIEKNTFFARKIIEDNYSLELTDENINNLNLLHLSLYNYQDW